MRKQHWLALGIGVAALIALSQMSVQAKDEPHAKSTTAKAEKLTFITYVGQANDHEIVVVGSNEQVASVYLEGVGWFSGDIGDAGSLDVTNAAGIRLEALISKNDVIGTLTFTDGTATAFVVERLAADTRLFDSELGGTTIFKSSPLIQKGFFQ